MTSAFSPVIQRASSPRMISVRLPSRRSSRTSKRDRQSSSLSDMIGRPLEQVSEGSREGESPVPPDHVSTSASEASASNASQAPVILDFIGATCQVTSWFTSCFPCSVVDIDEQDGQVMDRLSRESAMNVMYNSPNSFTKMEDDEPLPEDAHLYDYHQGVAAHLPFVGSPQIGAVDSDVMYTHLPIMTVTGSEHIHSQGSDHKLHVIEDDETTGVESMSLDSESRVISPTHSPWRKKHTMMPKKMKKLFSSSNKKKNVERPPLVRS